MTAQTRFSRRGMMLMPLVFPLALSACKEGEDILKLTGETMGTTYSIVAINTPRRLSKDDVQIAVKTALDTVDRQMSNWRADSEISLFNASGSVNGMALSPELLEVMTAADAVNQASDGCFDTCMGPLIELWGFGANGEQNIPLDADIAALTTTSGHTNSIQLGDGTLRKMRPDAHVFLAGIGKGFGADLVGRSLEALGIEDYMVEIGGDLFAKGVNPDGVPWQIGIETPNPGERSVFDVVGLSGKGLATSGDYRNFFERDGRRFSHLLDPTTGYPVTHSTASATVLADNAMLADAWSTAMLVLGRERGLEIATKHDIAVQFIERTADVDKTIFDTYVSNAFTRLTA